MHLIVLLKLAGCQGDRKFLWRFSNFHYVVFLAINSGGPPHDKTSTCETYHGFYPDFELHDYIDLRASGVESNFFKVCRNDSLSTDQFLLSSCHLAYYS